MMDCNQIDKIDNHPQRVALLAKMQLEKKVDNLIKDCDQELKDKIASLEKSCSVWQAYVETVDSLGQSWRSLGRNSRGIPDSEYSLAHLVLFKNLPVNVKRVILVKMEELMNTRPFMKSDEALQLFKNI